MIRLTTFGGPALVDDAGKRIEPILAQPRRLALLVYLAVEGRRQGVRRDVVLGTFWPEASQSRASRSLSQSMLYLRRALGTAALSEPGRGDLSVNPAGLVSDVDVFLTAIEAGRPIEAVAAYGGDFMRGFYLDDAPEFEQWLEETRLYFRRLAAEAAMAEARAAGARGEPIAAATYARRAAELGLFAEVVVRDQMELLGGLGDYAGALEAYEQLKCRLRRELEMEPSPQTEGLAAQLRERALQASASTVAVYEAAAAGDAETGVAPLVVTPPARRRRRTSSLAAAAVAMLVFAGLVPVWGLIDGRPTPVATGAPVLLIDDFVEGGSIPRGAGEALVADLVGKLSLVSGIAAKYVASPLATPEPAHGTAPLVVRGYVTRTSSPNSIQVSVTLLNGVTGEGVAHRVLEYDSAQFAMLDAVSDDLADLARREAGRYFKAAGLAAGNPAAGAIARQVQRLRFLADSLRSEGNTAAAFAAFEAADSLLMRPEISQAGPAAAMAERAEIRLARAWVHLTPAAFDPAAFKESMQRALDLANEAASLDANSAHAHEVRGVALHFLRESESAGAPSARINRLARDSEAALRRAIAIAPARARPWALLSAAHYSRGEFHQARSAAERAYTANAYLEDSADLLQRLFYTSLETGDPAAAGRWCAEIGRRHADTWIHADCNMQLPAWSSPDRRALLDAATIVERFRAANRMPFMVARLEMTLGVLAAKAGVHADSALAIQNAALKRSPGDADLAPLRAWLWQALGRPDSARVVLTKYVRADAARRAGVMHSQRFRATPAVTTVRRQSLQ